MKNTKDITSEEIKFIEARTQGKTKSQAAMIAKPNIKPSSAGAIGVKLSKSVNVQAVLAKKLKKHKITIDRALAPIDRGLDAKKTIIIGKGEDAFADQIDDIPTQLGASDRALKLLGVTDKPKDETPPGDTNLAPAILEAIQSGDIKELQRVIFKSPEKPPQGSTEAE